MAAIHHRRRRHRRIVSQSLDRLDPLLAQNPLHTADGVALAIKQAADATQQIDIVGAIVAAPAAALHRLDLGEAGFPEAQHVLRDVEIVGDLADGPECIGGLVQMPHPFEGAGPGTWFVKPRTGFAIRTHSNTGKPPGATRDPNQETRLSRP